MSYSEARQDLLQLEGLLRDAGITLEEMHHEHGILDTAPELDEGWLFAPGADKKVFLTEIPVQ
jgi:hypothetical protein